MEQKEIKNTEVTEMVAHPTPQWIRSAGKEIQEKYDLDYVDKIYISGIICKHYRIGNTKKSNERKYFLRFGNLPENGKSSIYRVDEKIGEEEGVSVFECTQDTFQLILPQELTRSLMSDVQGFFNYCNRPLYLVSGIQIGTGHDNEPIIIDVRIEKELPYNK